VLLALLIVSAALNLCFIAGAVWTRLQPPPASSRAAARDDQIAAQLGLDGHQRAAFDRYVVAMHQRREQMHQELAPVVRAAWGAMAKPGADAQQAMQLLDQASDKWRQFRHETVLQTRDFLATLSSDQRSKFIALVRDGQPPWWGSHPPHR
jgi:uncharacterized membrane protein